MAQAGEGLAAAHHAGLVHRDFKPENVIVGDDGRARVTDFGLALLPDGDALPAADAAVAVTALTATGALLGTPAYMAPEQLAGAPADARSDQFSFCATLFEALHGRRPFDGDSVGALREAIGARRFVDVPRGDVPAWLDAAVRRGLHPDPARRHPSLRALLHGLRADTRRERRLHVGATLASACVALGAAAFAARAPRAAAPCDGAAALRDVWSPARAASVTARFTAVAGPTGASIANAADASLRAWGERWVRANDRACRLSLPATQRCLARHLAALDDVARAWPAADRDVALRLPDGLGELPSIESCDAAGESPRPSDPARLARLVTAERAFSEARRALLAGHAAQAVGPLASLAAEAEAIAYRSFSAEVHLAWSRAARRTGATTLAGEAARTAILRAEAARDDDTAARAWVELAGARGEAGAWGELDALCAHADAAITRAGDPGDLRASLSLVRGTAAAFGGRFEEAARHLGDALAWRERSREVTGPTRPRVLTALGDVARRRGALDEALSLHERALAAEEALRGGDHPDLARYHHNRAGVLRLLARATADPALRSARLDDAATAYERALALERAGAGDDAPHAALTCNSLGLIALERGDFGGAGRWFARAAGPLERAGHPDRALVWANQAIVLMRRGRADEALARLAEAEAVERGRAGPRSVAVARITKLRGMALLAAHRSDEAARALTSAAAIAAEHARDDAEARAIREEALALRAAIPARVAAVGRVAPVAPPPPPARTAPARASLPPASSSGGYGGVGSWDPG